VHHALAAVARGQKHAQQKLALGDRATFPAEPPPGWLPRYICHKWRRVTDFVPALSELREILHSINALEHADRSTRDRRPTPRIRLPQRAKVPASKAIQPQPRVRRTASAKTRMRTTSSRAARPTATLTTAIEPAIAAASEPLALPDSAGAHLDDIPGPQVPPKPRSRVRRLSLVGGGAR
jgi:hypothetical protein